MEQKMTNRSFENIKKHYIVEKALADRLKNSTKEQRKKLYSSVYDELFQRVSDHPQILRKVSDESKNKTAFEQLKFALKFIKPQYTFLEIGAGDCHVSFNVAKVASKVFAVDVSEEIACNNKKLKNFELILSDGTSVPVDEKTVDIAYSNQLIEHLHPDDTLEQTVNVFRCLKSNGKYICVTSHKFSGPHDISKHFDKEAKGLHLKEYTYSELSSLMKKAGFKTINTYIGGRGIYMRFPYLLTILTEKLFCLLPYKLRKKLSSSLPFNSFFGTLALIAIK